MYVYVCAINSVPIALSLSRCVHIARLLTEAVVEPVIIIMQHALLSIAPYLLISSHRPLAETLQRHRQTPSYAAIVYRNILYKTSNKHSYL